MVSIQLVFKVALNTKNHIKSSKISFDPAS